MRTILIACIVWGCSNSGSSGSFSLAVSDPSWGWNNQRADPNTLYFQASVTLANSGEQVPLSTSFQQFFVETTDQREVTPSVNSAQLAGACDGTVMVAAGGQATCKVLWEVPSDATPSAVVYRDSLGRNASGPFTAPEKPAAPACLAALAAVPRLATSFQCAGCGSGGTGTPGCQQPDPSCMQPSSCGSSGGQQYCSASCPPTPSCDQQATSYFQCLAQQCAAYCS